MPSQAQTDVRARPPSSRKRISWSGGRIRSLRAALLLAIALAVTPTMLLASGMAVLRAFQSHQLPGAAAWLTVSTLPLLLGVIAMLIAAAACEAMVMRWLTYLERLSRAYARGRYSLRPRRLHNAPAEFRGLGQAVEEMAAAVEHRDQALRDALDEQTILLREVHHRVKNNLQIVGSLLSLQASRATEPAVRDALVDALVRLDAISLGQRFMREQEEEEQVLSTDLFESFIRQLRARLGAGRRPLDITADIEPRSMPLETGSRLVLLAAETLLHACHASSGALVFRVTLRFDDNFVVMHLSPAPDPECSSPAAGVCRDLIQGYARQLRARVEPAADGSALKVRAPIPGPQPAAANDAAPGPSGQGPKFFRILDRTQRGVAS
jgi:two-component sensor histidine kinase